MEGIFQSTTTEIGKVGVLKSTNPAAAIDIGDLDTGHVRAGLIDNTTKFGGARNITV